MIIGEGISRYPDGVKRQTRRISGEPLLLECCLLHGGACLAQNVWPLLVGNPALNTNARHTFTLIALPDS
jgi:hypothetical protein